MRRRGFLAVAAACAVPLVSGCADPGDGGGDDGGSGSGEGRTYGGPDGAPQAALGPAADR